jgi:DNA-binding PadR family transcriptional regulator
LYVSGWDEDYELGHQSRFRGRRAGKGHDFEILDLLTKDGLLEEQHNPKQIKSVVLTPKGIKQARYILKNLNLEGIEELLQNHDNRDSLIEELEQEKEQFGDEN